MRRALVAFLLAHSALGAKPRLPLGRAAASQAPPSAPPSVAPPTWRQPEARVQLRVRLSAPQPAPPSNEASEHQWATAEPLAPPSMDQRPRSNDAGVSSTSKLDGYRTVAGGAVVHLVFGALYCWGNFQAYAPSRLRFFDGDSSARPSGSTPDILTVMPLTIVAQALAMPLGALLATRVGPRLVTLAGGLLTALGSLAAGKAVEAGVGGLKAVALLYAGILGAGIGLGYTSPMVAGYAYFPQSKGVVSGTILGAFGVGGFLFNKIGSRLFNPEGVSADPVTRLFPASVTDSFGRTLQLLGFMYAATAVAGALLMRPLWRPPAARVPGNADGRAHVAGGVPEALATEAIPGSFTVGSALRTRSFWALWAAVALSAQGGLYVAGAYKANAMAFSHLNDDTFLATVGALGSIVNGLARPFWGWLCDAVGFRRVFSLVTLIQASVLFALPRHLTASRARYAAAVCLLFMCTAANFTVVPTESAACFGNAAVYGVLYSAFASAALAGTAGATALAGARGSGTAFAALSFSSLCAMAVVQGHRRPAPPAAAAPPRDRAEAPELARGP